jgi:hypothetical protein
LSGLHFKLSPIRNGFSPNTDVRELVCTLMAREALEKQSSFIVKEHFEERGS